MQKIFKVKLRIARPNVDGNTLNFKTKYEDIFYGIDEFNNKFQNFKELKLIEIGDKYMSMLLSIFVESEEVNVDGRDLSYFSKRLYDDRDWNTYSLIDSRLFNAVDVIDVTKEYIDKFDSMDVIPNGDYCELIFEKKDNIEDDVDEEDITMEYSITSYGADYDVEGLVNKLNKGRIYIPNFQRQYVWKQDQASRLIESLLMGLPIPGIFLSKDDETSKLLIIDGQQRLRTLQYFYKGIFEPNGRKFKLRNVHPNYDGKTYEELSENDKAKIDESIIHATIIKQDEPSEDDSSVFYIFERINTGGTQLTPQEIRVCIYNGEFSDFLRTLQLSKEWKNIYGKPNIKLKDQELILRFFALYYDLNNYEKPLKGFLNKFMKKNKKFDVVSKEELNKVFFNTVNFIYRALGKEAFRPVKQIKASVFDSVMIGTAKRLEEGSIIDIENYVRKYNELMEIPEYIESITAGTSDKDVVSKRLTLAIDAFSSIE
ncbi:MAG: DUF262 domain-containing protein [Anaeromicrobium sp.]|jgi:uncharacterized protein with ParB-like and HNH nuclease domain|uniref:DUF262 domain-containing protein n=1 Tax=Anaeromicrobium sp. TaxID=1929132 RepID=UPI0025E47D40|nr:DUF262 domain-containing protein [Anaeromicrobium sp.]MCT4593533.1 DUF262 domain-containing protein [Anaeromicrobium sp.]